MLNNYGVLIAYIVGVFLLLLLGRILLIPLKVILKLVINALIGGFVLVIINFAGGFFNYHIALNAFSAIIVGTLGLSGVFLLIVLKLILN